MTKTIRCFIAIDLPQPTQNYLVKLIDQLKTRIPDGVRWLPVKNIHLTLFFLGDIQAKDIIILTDALQDRISPLSTFILSLDNIGAFPNVRKPGIIKVGVTAAPSLNRLKGLVDQVAESISIPAEKRPFSPHLTLGRVSRSATSSQLTILSDNLTQDVIPINQEFDVNCVSLFRSDLFPQGAAYSKLFSVNLM